MKRIIKNYTIKSCMTALALGCLAGAVSAKELKMSHFSSPTYPLYVEVMAPLAEKVAETTGGDLTIRIYHGGELGADASKQYERTFEGVADISLALPGYTASQFRKSLMIELPGVVPGGEDVTETVWANVEQLDDEFRRTKLLGFWSNSPGVLMTADKPIRTLDDIKGMKIRVPSKNVGRVIEAWGGTPVSMPITEVYNSLSTGVIDGILVDPSPLDNFKLNEVVNYVTVGMHSTNSPMMLVMNRDSYAGLSDEHRAALDALTGLGLSKAGRDTQVKGAEEALKNFTDMGKEIITLSPEEAARFNAESDALVDTVVTELKSNGVDVADYVSALRN